MSASNFVRKLRPLVSVIGLFLISNLLVAFLLSTSPSPLRSLSEVTDFTNKNISIVLNAYLLQLLLYEIAYLVEKQMKKISVQDYGDVLISEVGHFRESSEWRRRCRQ